jgi:hypothetical protein
LVSRSKDTARLALRQSIAIGRFRIQRSAWKPRNVRPSDSLAHKLDVVEVDDVQMVRPQQPETSFDRPADPVRRVLEHVAVDGLVATAFGDEGVRVAREVLRQPLEGLA